MKYSIFFIVLISGLSCGPDFFTPVVEIDIDVPKSKLVLFGNFEEGSDTVWVYLCKTRAVLDNTKYPRVSNDTVFWNLNDKTKFYVRTFSTGDTVSNAKIDLYKNQVYLTTFQSIRANNTQFRAQLSQPLIYEQGTSYTIKVAAPGLDPIEATSFIPGPAQIDTMSFRPQVRIAIPNEPFTTDIYNEYTLSLKDTPGEKNFYRVSGYFTDSMARQEPLNNLTSYDFKSVNGYLADESFDGKKTTWDVHEYGWNNIIFRYPYARFTLHSISESLYLYQLSVIRYSRAHDDPFSEPVILYTNVKNGFGVFSISSSRSYLLKLK